MSLRFLIFIAFAGIASAQVPTVKPSGATGLPGVDFSRIVGVRELADGRVLVTDAIEKQLYVVDFARRTSEKRGRQGAGPGEYRSPGQLWALSADSTVLIDNLGGRWLVMARDSFVAVISGNDPALAGGRQPIGVDGQGHLLTSRSARNLNGAVGNLLFTNDSSWVLRVERRTGRVDTVGKFQVRPARIQITGTSDAPTSVSIQMNPISTGEQAVYFADGAIAIARLDPYRVDWIFSGRTTAGKPLPFEAIPVSREEQVAAIARLPRNDGETPRAPEEIRDWPAVIPPFTSNGVYAAPDGTVWIRRIPSTRHSLNDYDVVDRAGRLARRIELPSNEAVAGFGKATFYTVLTDDDGLQHLRRYPMPR
jgi:hypothetical protein